jgi:hypothetical protein
MVIHRGKLVISVNVGLAILLRKQVSHGKRSKRYLIFRRNESIEVHPVLPMNAPNVVYLCATIPTVGRDILNSDFSVGLLRLY